MAGAHTARGLAQIGITATDLLTTAPAVPTFGHVIPKLRATLTPGTCNIHINWLETTWHTHPLDQISKAALDQRAHANKRRPAPPAAAFTNKPMPLHI
ncbi:hypothetical protein ACIHDR_07055 [Nocardia sp. NPDC052278]|uniref:hypothetical protein n=1 Tax=unclassified Nocardia TaxID=2637762 RepID=UPI0036A47B37